MGINLFLVKSRSSTIQDLFLFVFTQDILHYPKIQIIRQFIFELIFISIPSIISSLFLGNLLLKVIVEGFINSENSMIFGGSLINKSSFMLNITTLAESYLILISIIVLSVVMASSLILFKKPKEILSKIS